MLALLEATPCVRAEDQPVTFRVVFDDLVLPTTLVHHTNDPQTDLNNDGAVNGEDLALLLGAWT